MTPWDIKQRLIDAQQLELEIIQLELEASKSETAPDEWAAAWDCAEAEIARVMLELNRIGTSASGVIDDHKSWEETLGDSPAEG